MKNIVFLIPNKDFGGAEKMTLWYYKLFQEFGHSVSLLILADTGHGIDLENYNPTILKSRSSMSSVFSLTQSIKKLNPDIIFVSRENALVTAILQKFLFGIKIIYRPPTLLRNELSRNLKYKLLRALLTYSYEYIDLFVAQSLEIHTELKERKIPVSKLIHISNLNSRKVKTSRSTNGISQVDTVTYLIVANVSFVKGLDVLIDAFDNMIDDYPNSELLIAGRVDSNYAIDLKTIVNKNKRINEKVKFLGWQSDVDDLFEKADVVVLSSRMEGFPNALVEANEHNKPIVSTRCCESVHELVVDRMNGILVEKNNSEDLMRGLIDVRSIDYQALQYRINDDTLPYLNVVINKL